MARTHKTEKSGVSLEAKTTDLLPKVLEGDHNTTTSVHAFRAGTLRRQHDLG